MSKAGLTVTVSFKLGGPAKWICLHAKYVEAEPAVSLLNVTMLRGYCALVMVPSRPSM